MDMKKEVPKDHIGIFRDIFRKHGEKELITIMLQKKGRFLWLQRLCGMKT
jgi:hypothetical protein